MSHGLSKTPLPYTTVPEQAELDSQKPAFSLSAEVRRRWPEKVIALGVLLTFCYLAEWELIVLLIAILLAFMLSPIVEGLQEVSVPRGVGSFAAVLLLMGILYGVAYVSYNQTVSFVANLPQAAHEIRSAIAPFRQRAETFEKSTEAVLEDESEANKTAAAAPTSSRFTDIVRVDFGSLSHAALAFSFVPFLVYFMLTWQQHVRSATVMLFRMENRHTAYRTLKLIAAMIRSFIVGNFLVGLFIAAVSTVLFALMGVPFFYVVGVVSGFLSMIPYLGVILAMVPPIVVGVGHMQPSDLLVIALIVFVVHLVGLNVLYPKFLGSRLQLNPLAVTVALLFWGWLWGAIGLALAIPITAAMKIIFDNVEGLRPYGNWMGE
jgi:predicted PurR-regulated permease PerM